MLRFLPIVLASALGFVVAPGCDESGTDADADNDIDGDVDSDTDTDTDGDTDADVDGDGDADGDTDVDGDGDTGPECGDDACDDGENAATCPEDCEAECGDTFCTHDETACTCASDCDECGDGECSMTEAGAGTCEADCPGVSHWVRICAGTFMMGSPVTEPDRFGDETQHEVTLTRDFEIRSTEVTLGEFRALMGRNPSGYSACGDACPVENVNWHEAAAYCNALSSGAGLVQCYTCSGSGADVTCEPTGNPYECRGYRLPTEAEWEYAARSGTTGPRYGDDLGAIAWYLDNSRYSTHAVGTRAASPWGLYDMLGNVWEWCRDWYGDYGGAVADPFGPGTGSVRVVRGGSWGDDAWNLRVALRYGYAPDSRHNFIGLRPLRSLP
jgi:formylglycine-generating enzyme required for sulfatase activity